MMVLIMEIEMVIMMEIKMVTSMGIIKVFITETTMETMMEI